MMMANPDSRLGVDAGRALLNYNGAGLIKNKIEGSNKNEIRTVIKALGNINNKEGRALLRSVILDTNNEQQVKQAAVKAFGASYSGKNELLKMIKDEELPDSLKPVAKDLLLNARRVDLRKEAVEYLGSAEHSGGTDIQPIAELVKMEGNSANGKNIFNQTCQTCHQVQGQGTQFGPDLSNIGDKLPKGGLYVAVLQPSAGISYGYAGYIVTLKDGTKVSGIIDSETGRELVLRIPGGFTKRLKKSNIKSRKKMNNSLMPNLASTFSQQELVDLVEYLSSLK